MPEVGVVGRLLLIVELGVASQDAVIDRAVQVRLRVDLGQVIRREGIRNVELFTDEADALRRVLADDLPGKAGQS